ncbi:PAAR domain-containing protein, partial [uncultured Shewanella sp.]|uniref:PAAR domain-containing protein n=1 Tax=uncultured Shewanella sp. TaxID=173975 RepID=UPI0026075691
PTPVISGSPNVKIDNKPAARVGDPLLPHIKPNNPPHNRKIASGSSTVFINGKPAAMHGGKISCGGITIGGGTVNIGDLYVPPSPMEKEQPFIETEESNDPKPNEAQSTKAKVIEKVKGSTPEMLDAAERAKKALSADTDSTPQKNTPQVDPNHMYWPAYDHTAEEGKKQIELDYAQPILELAILSPDEWSEFFTNVGHAVAGTMAAKGTRDAVQTAKALGGYGVTAYVKSYNGVDYIILKNYKKHLKTLLAGTRYKASNPQVVQLGLAALKSAKGMVSYVTVSAPVELMIGSAVNGAQFLLNDQYTLEQLGVDEARLVVNTIVTAGLALAAGIAFPGIAATVVGSGCILAVSGLLVHSVDTETNYSTDFVNFIKEQFK